MLPSSLLSALAMTGKGAVFCTIWTRHLTVTYLWVHSLSLLWADIEESGVKDLMILLQPVRLSIVRGPVMAGIRMRETSRAEP